MPNREAALALASRSIALRGICELWSHEHNFDDFHLNLKRYLKVNANELQDCFSKDISFKITVEAYNKHFTQSEKVSKIESLHYLPVEGNVDLSHPKVEWWYIEYWGMNPLKVPNAPESILFGRWVKSFVLICDDFIKFTFNFFSFFIAG